MLKVAIGEKIEVVVHPGALWVMRASRESGQGIRSHNHKLRRVALGHYLLPILHPLPPSPGGTSEWFRQAYVPAGQSELTLELLLEAGTETLRWD